jgi:rhodanese-related sulfurtransferase
MEYLKRAAAQAAVILVIGFIIAFAHNAVSVNGINPFRKIADVPVVPEDGGETAAGIKVIGLERMREIVEAGDPVIDARTAAEYVQGHIPGALLLDYYEMGRYFGGVVSHLTKDEVITLYCAGPDCEDSELLAREFYSMGYTNLLVFKGGYAEWLGAGLPVKTNSSGETVSPMEEKDADP